MNLVNAIYTGPENVGRYSFHSIDHCKEDKFGRRGNIINFSIKRPIMNNILTVYLPTAMLLVISQMSTAYDQSSKELVIEVNITILLVLTTLYLTFNRSYRLICICLYCSFIGISSELPATGYVKMVDIWMIFTIFYPFLQLFLHSWIEVTWICVLLFRKVLSVVYFRSSMVLTLKDLFFKGKLKVNF